MSRMEIPLGESSVKTACVIVNELKHDSDTDYGYVGSPKFEFNSWSLSDEDLISVKIKFEEWSFEREHIDNFMDFVESLEPVVDVDFYISNDSPIIFNLKIDQDEALAGFNRTNGQGDT